MNGELNKAIEIWLSDHIEERFSRSGGPGGQNVNKLNTKVTARIVIESVDVLNDKQKSLVRNKLHGRINEDDELVISVSDTRSQLKNREIALIRLANLITSSLHVPRKRKKTRPSRGSKEKRLDNKRKISEKKNRRRSVDY